MTRYATPKLGAYVVLTALGLLASLIFARPELALIAVPFAVLLAVGLAYARKPDVRVHLELDRERVLEGDEITLEVELDARDSVARLELLLEIPRGLEPVGGRNPVALRLEAGEERLVELRFCCSRWGAYRLGDVHLRARDAAGLLAWEQTLERGAALRVYPRPGTATAFTSSGVAKSRPCSAARQRASFSSASEPRGLAPTCSRGLDRVAPTSSTM